MQGSLPPPPAPLVRRAGQRFLNIWHFGCFHEPFFMKWRSLWLFLWMATSSLNRSKEQISLPKMLFFVGQVSRGFTCCHIVVCRFRFASYTTANTLQRKILETPVARVFFFLSFFLAGSSSAYLLTLTLVHITVGCNFQIGWKHYLINSPFQKSTFLGTSP